MFVFQWQSPPAVIMMEAKEEGRWHYYSTELQSRAGSTTQDLNKGDRCLLPIGLLIVVYSNHDHFCSHILTNFSLL